MAFDDRSGKHIRARLTPYKLHIPLRQHQGLERKVATMDIDRYEGSRSTNGGCEVLNKRRGHNDKIFDLVRHPRTCALVLTLPKTTLELNGGTKVASPNFALHLCKVREVSTCCNHVALIMHVLILLQSEG